MEDSSLIIDPKASPDVQAAQAALSLMSTLSDRMNYAARQRMTHNNRRNFMKVVGYPEAPDYAEFWSRYLRQGVAARAIDLPVETTWGGGQIRIDGFEGWEEFERRLKVTARLTEVDRLAGIGEFAVLMIGVREPEENDVADRNRLLEQPVQRLGSLDDIIFLRQFARDKVEIEKIETDASNERFGLPTMYSIDFDPGYRSLKHSDLKVNKKKLVHWTRLIHVTSSAMLNEVEGIPRLMKTLDNLINLDKIVGGGAEIWWQGADRTLHLDSKGKLGPTVKTDFRDQLEEVVHGFQRLLLTSNADLTTLPSVTPDPGSFAEVLMTLIAAEVGIPKRILFGSERGELASTQDRNNFADMISHRRSTYAKPMILDKFLERLSDWGIAASIEKMVPIWPPIEILSVMEKAEVQKKRVEAIKIAEDAAALGNVASPEQLRRELDLEDATDEVISINEDPSIDEDLDEGDPDVAAQFEAGRRSRLAA